MFQQPRLALKPRALTPNQWEFTFNSFTSSGHAIDVSVLSLIKLKKQIPTKQINKELRIYRLGICLQMMQND